MRQETKFPEEAGTTLTVDADEPVALTLRVRIPGWVAGAARVKINGKQSDVSAEAGSYLAIARTWVKGDRVEIGLPMALHSEGMADDHSLRAVLYGPMVLAGKMGSEGLSKDLQLGPEGPELKKAPAVHLYDPASPYYRKWIKPGDKALTFETSGQNKNVALEPFYKVSGERYSLYWRMT